ncbi:hypothetical protein GSI_10862 [Ganoderma sinense ZZ0214-1]|uniref:Uncharacterized protein n=1 Tax=Ganoderma sinense ZZ0214-1 TaxID=1077348 RepID=A0A2G8S1R1_9APHY|nr:hypothetical protein GSI_10862 [Ganoderma sinense ZZ0214-1]
MLRCQLVNRRFRSIIESMLRQYRAWLKANALTNVEDSQIPLKDRRKMLLRYHRAWESLSPEGTSPPGLSFYPISTHIPSRQPSPLVLESGWVVVSDFRGGLSFLKLSTISSPDGRSNRNAWSMKKQLTSSQLPPGLMTYQFDPSQDLLICLAVINPDENPKIVVVSMSTGGQPHPQAGLPIFDSGIEEVDEINSLRVHKGLVALYAGADDERVLQVWNWKTGKLLMMKENFDAWGDTVTFVGDNVLLLAQEDILHLFIFDLDGLSCTCDLRLPRFSQDAGVQLWTTVSSPFSSAPAPGHAFAPDSADSIVVVNMARAVPGTDAGTKCSLLLAIRLAGLMAQARRALLARPAADTDTDIDTNVSAPAMPTPTPTPFKLGVPWAQWGPAHTRFVVVPETWEAPSTFGRRCALAYHTAAGAPELALFDFGVDAPEVVMGAHAYALGAGWSAEVLPAPAAVDMRLWFEDEDEAWVESELPCRVRRRRLPPEDGEQKVVAAMLWEDGIILKTSRGYQCDYVSMSLHAQPPALAAGPPISQLPPAPLLPAPSRGSV